MRERARAWLVPAVSVGLAALPVVVAPLRALAGGWIPLGDNGLILLRTQDVATAHHPLLGTWTSASRSAGENFNNPGPLWFDALAPLVKVAGSTVGFALAVMVTNLLAIVGAALVAHRVGGERAMVLVTALSAGLSWTMGSELLFDAWQPHGLILPFWALLVLCWGLGSGHLLMAPAVVGVASLLVQTHLSYVYVVAVIGLIALVLASASVAHAWRGGDEAWRATRATLVRATWWSVGVGVLAWLQPFIDQVAGTGNLATLFAAGGGGDEQVGFELGARIVASVVALPPWWTRPGFSTIVRATGVVDDPKGRTVELGNIGDATAAVAGLAVVALVLTAVVVAGWRRRSRPLVAVGVTAAGGVAGALISMIVFPIGTLGIAPHQVRWLWPISAFVLFAALLALAEWAPMRAVVVPLGLATTGAFALLNLPTYAAREGPTADRDATATTRELLEQLAGYDPGEPVLFDVSTLRVFEPYSGPVLAMLGRSGVDVVVNDDGMVHQLGERRRASGDERIRIAQLEGRAIAAPPEGARLIAYAEALGETDAAELAALRAEVIALATRDGLQLNEAGRRARLEGRLGFPDVVLEPGADARELEASGFLASLVTDGMVTLPAETAGTFRRYAELDRRAERSTVALFEVPIT